MPSDRRCRGCCRAACGPEEEQIDGFLKNQIRAAGVQATALLKFRAQNICRPFYLQAAIITNFYKEDYIPCEPVLSISEQEN